MALSIDKSKEVVNTIEIVRTTPQHLALGIAQSVIWRVYRKSALRRIKNKLLLPAAHRGSVPAGNSAIIDALRLIGHHKTLVDAHNLAIALAYGAGTDRVIERKEVLCGALKFHVALVIVCRELLESVAHLHIHNARAITHGTCHRVSHARHGILLVANLEAVNNNH